MTRLFPHRVAVAAVALALSNLTATGTASAAPAADSAYATDRQDSYVFDRTAQAIGVVNTILCYVDAMNPDELVGAGPYVALVNENRCDSDRRSNSSGASDTGGGATAPSYARTIVNAAAEATGSTRMRARVWVDEDHDGERGTISVNLSAGAGPSITNPYGDFRLDYKSIAEGPGGAPVPRGGGFLAGSSTGLRFAEDEGGGRTKRLALTRNGETSGAGSIATTDPGAGAVTYQFAYNATHFLRRTSGGPIDECFDRRESAASRSVWRYGVYREDGSRLERRGGFPWRFVPRWIKCCGRCLVALEGCDRPALHAQFQ